MHLSRSSYAFLLSFVLAAVVAPLTTVAATSPNAADDLPASLERAIERSLYRIEPHPSDAGAYEAHNEQHRFAATFRAGGVVVSMRDESVWGMRLATYGRPGQMVHTADATLHANGNRIEYRRGALVEWYVNDPRGLEQGFTLQERPEGARELLVDLAVTGPLEGRENGSDLTFESQAAKLGYSKLFAVDATGAVLPSSMELVSRVGQEPVIRLTVDDSDAAYPVVIDPILTNEKKLTDPGGAPFDSLGFSVSISGDTAVVGVPFAGPGAAHVYQRNLGGVDNWGEVKELMASDGVSGDQLGYSVAIDGDTIVVGARLNEHAFNHAGSAYVYERDLGGVDNWGEAKKLVASVPDGADYFGSSVGISGDAIVAGAPRYRSLRGAVFIYERDAGGAGNWGEVQWRRASDRQIGDVFGTAVSIDGDLLLVGAPGDDDAGTSSGSAYLFDRNQGGAPNWGEANKLVASDAAAGDEFGRAVAISGETASVGAPEDDSGRGAVYLYDRHAGGVDNWGEVQKRLASDGAAGDLLGWSVSISGDLVVAGARNDDLQTGSAYLYERDLGGADSWGELVKLTASDAATEAFYGRAVSISGSTVLVGADNADGKGAAYVHFGVCGDGGLDFGEACDDGNTVDGDCCSSSCTIEVAGTECRAAAGLCDVAEVCDGIAGSCPADVFETAGTECRGAAGVCDVAETCTGGSATCPVDGKSTAECRGSAGVCDVAETCDGIADTCPADAKSTAECRGSAGVCDVAETCDGTADSCPADAFAIAGTECRGSGGVCDVAEACDGGSAACPADTKLAVGTECRSSAGSCDVAEVCDGATDSCPADAFVTPGTECRAAGGLCDVAETCDGAGASCPADAKQSVGTECRGSAGSCDVAEVCDGSTDNCPADGFETAGTECRAAGGVCDVAETCDGGSASCPADAKETAGTECRGAAGSCDVAEVCDGSSDSCPADGFESAATECRASSGVCDVAESCDGASAACPADGFATAGTECRAASGICDVAESCDGASADCPVDGFESAGTECPDGDLCNGTETCDGSGTCQSATGPSCDDANPCTMDSCDPVLGCSNDAAPATTCADTWQKGQLLVNEKAVGKEKVIVKLIKGPALTQADFGDPVLGSTAYDLCVYDDAGQLAAHMQVDRAGLDCAGKPCWKALGTKGFLYKDKDLSSDGVQLIKLLGGDEGKSKLLVKAKNNAAKGQLDMPVGISAALAGSTSATVQLHGSAPEGCYSTTLVDVITNDANLFKAK